MFAAHADAGVSSTASAGSLTDMRESPGSPS
jgi:hypothetical protein